MFELEVLNPIAKQRAMVNDKTRMERSTWMIRKPMRRW